MQYTVQLNTGSLEQSMMDAGQAIRSLSYCMEKIKIRRVIFGWSKDSELNREISSFLAQHQIEQYLWLPVFAEIHGTQREENLSIISSKKKEVELYGGDEFDFVCQSSEKNLAHVLEVFEKIAEPLQLDGVFLDRIRYESAATSPMAAYGCWCPRCRNIYERYGVDAEHIRELAGHMQPEQFMPAEREGFIYHYENPYIERLMSARRDIVSGHVGRLRDAFHSKGFKVGADVFDPSVADLVGQDLTALSQGMEFIKPMVYLRTNAPAGVPFEMGVLGDRMKERINTLWGGNVYQMDTAVEQMQLLKKTGAKVAPGIDANQVEGICSADPQYVGAYLGALADAGIGEAVLSWNLAAMSDETFEAAAQLQS